MWIRLESNPESADLSAISRRPERSIEPRVALVFEPPNACGEPGAVRGVTNEEHGAGTSGRRRRQDVVYSEITVGFKCDAGRVRAVLCERRGRFTNQRRKNLHVGRRADAVAPGQQQATPVDRDASVDLHLGPEIVDPPQLARGVHTADHVRSSNGRGRIDADAALEPHQSVIRDERQWEKRDHGEYEECNGFHGAASWWWLTEVSGWSIASAQQTRGASQRFPGFGRTEGIGRQSTSPGETSDGSY